MKIVVVGGYAPSLISFRGPLLKRLVSLGHEVHALAPLHTPDVGPQLEAMGVDYSVLPLNRRGLNLFADLGSLLHLKQSIHRIRPDVVLSYTFKPIVYASMAARMAWVGDKKKVFGMVTGLGYAFTEAKGLKRRIMFNIAKGMYSSGIRYCNGLIFQNPDDEAFFKKLGVVPGNVDTTVVNGSGVDLEHYAVAPLPEKPSFLCLSRLLGAKGVREYAQAAIKLKAKYPEVPFRLIGPREEGADVIKEKEVNKWREQGLEVLGAVDDVRPEIAQASVYVLPSYREGTPRSVLEAMSMGRPVVTSDVPGCRETVVEGENGFLTPMKDVDALAAAMEKFIVDPSLAARMGEASRRMAEEKYDVDKVNDAILEFMGLI
ncbi:glycosyltransferase family 4 protein [Pseudodesulfovibrio sp. zrk46]|uniref:glycosyltransferase family 4 protein n=1 Tax=Pseudodesulfovibrio sp. zrk46 TaxID=2725288 RepID=UPI001449FDEF|nr:glycosyltransferase family 4 protein [Pseudodesulfovibrio sp. zrk46]QJB55889.1 glycosyltransferase family 4 protein [Pseudodesulfovibrio sp. zrk46]